jgi:putative heme-binding domain-containing protein
LLPHVAPERAGEILLDLLASSQSAAIHAAAAAALAELPDETIWRRAVASWNTLPLGPRRGLMSGLVQSPARAGLLLAALEERVIAPLEIDAAQRDALLRSADASLRERAAKAFAELEGTDRGQIIERYRPALDLAGDRAKGAVVFAQNCLACHAVQGVGHKVGPDLSGIGVRPPDALLADLFDPSRLTPSEYVGYTLLTVDGRVLTGLVAGESPATVTLRQADGIEHTVARDQIEELHATGKSLMPDGFEQKVDVQGLADLFAFLRQPDKSLLPQEGVRAAGASR